MQPRSMSLRRFEQGRVAMIALACPRCHAPLEPAAADHLVCPADRLDFHCMQGVWRMLLPERQAVYHQFIREYETVRKAEGRGSTTAAYYRALPYRYPEKSAAADWQIRAASFDAFLRRVLDPLEASGGRPLHILDLGAGNGWLSNRLAARGHQLAALDLTTNDFDGLGCHRFYESHFLPVQAEFDHLPFTNRSADVVLFNASLHYSTCLEETLREALRVSSPDGQVVILDTPFYHDQASGAQMVQERQDQFVKKYGFPSNALASENYLTYRRLAGMAEKLDFEYRIWTPFYGVAWALRPWKNRLLGRREPAQFHLVVIRAQAGKNGFSAG